MDTITEKKYTTANFEGLFKLENLSDNKTKFLIYGLGESGKAAIKFLASENVEAKNIYILDDNINSKNWEFITEEFVIPKANIYCGFIIDKFTKKLFAAFEKFGKKIITAIQKQKINYVILSPGVPVRNWENILKNILPTNENTDENNAANNSENSENSENSNNSNNSNEKVYINYKNYIDLISEIDLFLWAKNKYCPTSKLVGITGCNGKTTTTALTTHLFNSAGISAIACGNISPSAIQALLDIKQSENSNNYPQVWVLELSSFQLETTHNLNADSVAILNLEPDHLDRYNNDLFKYIFAKTNILQGARSAWFNRSDTNTLNFFGAFQHHDIYKKANLRLNLFGVGRSKFDKKPEFPQGFFYNRLTKFLCQGEQNLVSSDDLKLKGEHNIANALAALALYNSVVNFIKLDNENGDTFKKNSSNLVEFDLLSDDKNFDKVITALKSFDNLPHRVQIVHQEDNGTIFIDDSKSTNISSTIAALKQVRSQMPEDAMLGLILGGEAKDQNFDTDEFYKALQEANILRIELLGKAAKSLRSMLIKRNEAAKVYNAAHPDNKQKLIRYKMAETSMPYAVFNLVKHIKNQPGSVILLSPACASTDMYKNYKERADDFVKNIEVALQTWKDKKSIPRPESANNNSKKPFNKHKKQ